MPGPNLAGTPNTDDYVLGRGVLYFSLIDANDRPTGWRDLGNSPEFTISLETETLEHRSSRAGTATIDKEIIISQDLNVSFTLDEINDENVAAAFSGEKATHTNPAVAGYAAVVLSASVELGRWYDIVDASNNRAYDVEVGFMTIQANGATPLVEGTDYTLDGEFGRVFLLSTAVNITAGDSLDVALAADAGAIDPINEVRALTQTSIEGALKFIEENAADGEKREVEIHKITLKAEGDVSFIAESELQAITFTGRASKAEAAFPNSPTMTIRKVG